MAQRRLGLYRQGLLGHRSDASIELPGVRQIQSRAKLMSFLCLWHSVSVLLSLKVVLVSGLTSEPFLLMATAKFGLETLRAGGCMETCPFDSWDCTHFQWPLHPEMGK